MFMYFLNYYYYTVHEEPRYSGGNMMQNSTVLEALCTYLMNARRIKSLLTGTPAEAYG